MLVSNNNLKAILTEFLKRVKELIPATIKSGNNNSETETAIGSFNVSSEDTLLSIGNGKSEDDRSNAFEVKQNGDIHITTNESSETVILQTLLAEPIPVEDVEELN